MRGEQLAAMLPPKPGKAREEAILDMVKRGHALVRWTPISVDLGSVRATFFVTAEPLMLGETWEDGFYPGVNAATMQKIADYYNATLLTPKLVDEIWKQADVRVDPFIGMTQTAAQLQVMADTATFVKHSQIIKDKIREQRRAPFTRAPLIANIGKYWTVGRDTSNRKKAGEGVGSASQNYGFFLTKKGARNRTVTLIPDVDLFQQPGTRHDYNHSDYSQVVMLVARAVELCQPTAVSGDSYVCNDGRTCQSPGGPGQVHCVDIYDLAGDPTLASLVSHEGTINMRMPDVAYEKPEGCVNLALSSFGSTSFGGTSTFCGRKPTSPQKIGAIATGLPQTRSATPEPVLGPNGEILRDTGMGFSGTSVLYGALAVGVGVATGYAATAIVRG